MRSRISEKGQVTIPKKLRDQLGIRAGDELDHGRLVVAKVADQDPVDAVWGTMPADALGGMSVDEWIDEIRGRAIPPLPGELES